MNSLSQLIALRGKEAAGPILAAIGKSDGCSQAYAVKTRVKKAKDLVEKVERKRNVKPDYSLTSITDVVGLRVVTLFRSELPDVVAAVLAEIRNSDGAFSPQSIEEVIIYSANPTFDYVAPKIEKRLLEYGVPKSLIQKRHSDTLYSSIHLIVRAGKDDNFIEDGELKGYLVPVEVQVRTVFEDAWGEIDHRFNYTQKRSTQGTSYPGRKLSQQESRSISSHLLSLKHFTDSCAAYADVIQQDFERSETRSLGKIVQIDEDEETEALLRKSGVSDELVDDFVRIGRDYSRARSDASLGNASVGPEPAIIAADAYLALTEKAISHYDDTSSERSLLVYFTQMNEALARLRSRAKDQTVRAGEMYTALAEEHPLKPAPAYRVGMVHRELEMFDEAIFEFEQAAALYSKIVSLDEAERRQHLLQSEEATLHYLLPKILGFSWYKKSEQTTDLEEKCLSLETALEKTLMFGDITPEAKDGSAVLDIKIDCLNNLLYYTGEVLAVCTSLNPGKLSELQERRQSYKNLLMKNFDPSTSDDIFTLETLWKDANDQEDVDQAKYFAGLIVDLKLPDGSGGTVRQLSLEETEIVAQAVRTLRR